METTEIKRQEVIEEFRKHGLRITKQRIAIAEAIFSEDDLPEKWAEYTEINARLCQDWPNITEKKDPLDDADEWKDKPDKLALLSEAPGEGT